MSSEDLRESFEELKHLSFSESTNENSTSQNEANAQPAEFVFQLDWATRDEIITKLNRYNQLFYSEKINTETKQKAVNDNIDLYQVLINLPLKRNAPAEGHPLDIVVLDLDFGTSSQIASALFANQNLVNFESTSEESKLKMIEQNKELIVKLLNLPVSAVSVDEFSQNGKSLRNSNSVKFPRNFVSC